MSTENRHSAPYSATDIEKYRKGELSAREMHDLEQAALDDPFLADAIEGLMQHPVSHQDLTDLKDRLNKKVTEDNRRVITMRIRRRITIAAALILLLGIGYTFFYRHPVQPDHALQPTTVAAATPPAQPAATPAPKAEANQAAAGRAETPKADSTRIAFTRPNITRSHPTRRRHLPPPVASAASTAEYKNQPAQQTQTDSIIPATIAKNLLKYYAPPIPRVYSGIVLDFQNRPLAGAWLALSGNPASGTITNNEGYFQISLHPVDTTRHLTVSLVGYDHASLAVNKLSYDNQASNVIHLAPSNADLDEVVVVGYGMHRKTAEAAAPSASNERLDSLWNSATPVIGRQAYLQYLNISKNKLGLDSTITGPETVSFIVSRDGTLSSFKIEQSLSPAHDNAIIRLVTDGPAWRLIRGKKVRAAVTVNF